MPEADLSDVEFTFTGPLVEWRGPAPYHFVKLPIDAADDVADLANLVTYGWGALPVVCWSADQTWTTSLFPREDTYFLPVKDAVRMPLGLELGDTVDVRMKFRR